MNNKALLLFFFLFFISTISIALLIINQTIKIKDERFIGFWKSKTGFNLYTFFRNGTCLFENDTLAEWSLDNGKIIFVYDEGHRKNTCNYSFINDKILIISGLTFYKIY